MRRMIKLLVLGIAVALVSQIAGHSQAQGTWTRITPGHGAQSARMAPRIASG